MAYKTFILNDRVNLLSKETLSLWSVEIRSLSIKHERAAKLYLKGIG